MLLPLIESTGATGQNPSNPVSKIIYQILEFAGIENLMVGTLVLTVLVFLAKGGLKFVEGAFKALLQKQLIIKLMTKMYDAYNQMDYLHYTKRNTGHFINILNVQIHRAVGAFIQLITFFTLLIMSVCLLGIAFFISWKLSLFTVAVGVLVMLSFRKLNQYISSLSRKNADEHTVLNKFLVQTLQALKYIMSTGQNAQLRKEVLKSVGLVAGYTYKMNVWKAFTTAVREPIAVFLIVGIIVFQTMILNEPMAPIIVAALLFYRGMRNIMGMQDNWQGTMNSAGSIEMVEKEFKETYDNREKDGNVKLEPLAQHIQYKNVSFNYATDQQETIHELNLDIPANTTIAVVGESGAGKTTLVDLLTLILKPSKGNILIDDTIANDIKLSTWRRQIGYVSQDTVVFDDTIANNICLWKGDYENNPETKQKVEEAAQKAYANVFINNMPDGYETVVGDRGVRLSGGQRQRLFIARELYKNPNLLIMDEATSALDTESERYIQESIDQLKRSLTVVIIAHRLSTIKNADIIYVMDKGKIIESGTFNELTAQNESRFSKMVNIQQI
jgi:ABC-type multidrug transport system fused ATPase/permease subunit